MTIEEFKKEVDKNIRNLFEKANKEEKELLNKMIKVINDLCEEEQKLKEQYCERTDCAGRLGESKRIEQLQIENEQLKEEIKQLKKELYASNISEEEWLEESEK